MATGAPALPGSPGSLLLARFPSSPPADRHGWGWGESSGAGRSRSPWATVEPGFGRGKVGSCAHASGCGGQRRFCSLKQSADIQRDSTERAVRAHLTVCGGFPVQDDSSFLKFLRKTGTKSAEVDSGNLLTASLGASRDSASEVLAAEASVKNLWVSLQSLVLGFDFFFSL